MCKLFHCEIEYLPSPHLMQIYTGFFKLQKKGIIDLKLKRLKYDGKKIPVINALINNKKVIYDTQDGLLWINKSREENLNFFQNHYNADFYFKRSFHKDLLNYAPEGCKVYPLGFNYNIHPDQNLFFLTDDFKKKVKYLIKTNTVLKEVFDKRFFYASDFEYYPIKSPEKKILFLTRLWDPQGADVLSEDDKQHREHINSVRIECLKACRQHYGDSFTGGLWEDNYSAKVFPSFVLPFNKTKKGEFLKHVKDHAICVATTGLFESIGWKMAEYIAAARAIVSEPLQYEVPGNFKEGDNYLHFTNASELIQKIDLLRNNEDLIAEMMKNNYHYYHNYLKPDILILNTLLSVINNY